MVAPDPDPRDADVDPPGIGLTVPGGRGWRVGRRAHSLGRIMEMELRYSLVRGQSRRRSAAAAAAASSSSPSAAHLYVMRVKPTWRGTENYFDLARSLSPWWYSEDRTCMDQRNVARRDFGSAHGPVWLLVALLALQENFACMEY